MASSSILNPNTPLAFLPPTIANQTQIAGYVFVGALSAFVWDWCSSLSQEYTILRKSRFSLPDITYVLSRFMTLGFCVSSTLFQVASVRHCQALLYIIGSFVLLSVSSTSLLFFFRVRAVWGNSKIITGFFGFLWVATLGSYVLVPLSLKGGHIGPTERCMNTAVQSFGFAPIFLNTVNDTLVFLAISYRILKHTTRGDSWRARAKSFLAGDGLPKLSKALLQGGQLYYFATIGLSIVFAAMLVSPGIPPIFHSILSVPNLALENAMACRVFRAVKLGFVKDYESSHVGISLGSSTARDDTGHELAFKRAALAESRIRIGVEIIKETDSKMYADNALGEQSSLEDGCTDARSM